MNTTTKNVAIGAGVVGLLYWLFSGSKKETSLGALPLLEGRKREDYPRMWQEIKAFRNWSSQKLQSDAKEEEKDLIDYLKTDLESLRERVGWVYTGNYGSEAYAFLRNRYLDIVKNKKGKQIKKALIALAIESFYFYCFYEYKSLNAAKVRSIVTKTLSKDQLEKFNISVVEKEILPAENDGMDSYSINDFDKDNTKSDIEEKLMKQLPEGVSRAKRKSKK